MPEYPHSGFDYITVLGLAQWLGILYPDHVRRHLNHSIGFICCTEVAAASYLLQIVHAIYSKGLPDHCSIDNANEA